MRDTIRYIFENNLLCPVKKVILQPEAITVILESEDFITALQNFNIKYYLMEFGFPIESVDLHDDTIELYMTTWSNNNVFNIMSSIAKKWKPADDYTEALKSEKLEFNDIFRKVFPQKFYFLWEKGGYGLTVDLLFKDKKGEIHEYSGHSIDHKTVYNDQTGLLNLFLKAFSSSIFLRIHNRKETSGQFEVEINEDTIDSFCFKFLGSPKNYSNITLFIKNNNLIDANSIYSYKIDEADKESMNLFVDTWNENLTKKYKNLFL